MQRGANSKIGAEYLKSYLVKHVPGPPKEPKIMAQYLKTESIGSIGSIVLAILEVQVSLGSVSLKV